MNLSRSIALLSLGASLLGAQHVDRLGASAGGRLQAELHFIGPGDAWFSTNEPAYVAIFEVFRTGVRQLYPAFSARAAMTTGAYRKVDLMLSPTLPSVAAVTPGMSLVALSSGGASLAGGWPRILLLVASTSPLRVDNWWSSSFAINQQLFGQRHWTDVQTEEGIDALVQLVRPLDPSAEVAVDRVDAISQPVFATTMLAYDPNRVALGYSCSTAGSSFISPTPLAGAECIALRNLPPTLPGLNAMSVIAAKVDTSARTPSKPAISESRNISDPAEIRRFIESQRVQQSAASSPLQASNSTASPGRTNVPDRRHGDPSAAIHKDVSRSPATSATSATPAARGPSQEWKQRPSAAPPAPSTPPAPKPAVTAPPPGGTIVTPVKP